MWLLRGLFLLLPFISEAQTGTIRGFVLDKNSGDPVAFATVRIEGTGIGVTTDIDGIFSITGLSAGTYEVIVNYLGYEPLVVNINLRAGEIVSRRLLLEESGIQLDAVDVSAARESAKSEVQVSKIMVTPKQIKSLPSTGGVADIAQYLPVLPGIIFTGDQGGQLYIRGGSPVQNRIMIDGMTIFNPFHSIGFFSVFETEAIRNIEVMTGGFAADHGGRVSAVVDITTREGNMKRMGGIVGVNPFQTSVLLEGPLIKLEEDSPSSASFLITGKQGYLNRTNSWLYPSASRDTFGLPFGYSDLYAKLSFMAGSTSRISVFGFNFTDNVDFGSVARINWRNSGGGLKMAIVPANSNALINAKLNLTNYEIGMVQADGRPRDSRVSSFNLGLDFAFFTTDSELKYGFDIEGINTDFIFVNFLNNRVDQENFNLDLAGFIKYRQKWGDLVFEPSARLIYYSSLNEMVFEPRLGMKYNITDQLRLKMAGGFYSQNLISSVNELDVVNLFVGFLSGPGTQIFEPGTRVPTDSRLQKAWHAIGGVEFDLLRNLTLNVEPYLKRFTQLVALNRNKLFATDPNFQAESGDAYGIDFSMSYTQERFTFWGTYSWARVTRDDGFQEYPPIFDRRHNVNALVTYTFGSIKQWEASARWNYGSGFPFTLTQGFYTQYLLNNGINSDVLTENGELGIIFDELRNRGRLPDYHRLDISLKRTWKFTRHSHLEAVASITNVYDRQNIFFFDRVTYNRVDQLPILPSMGVNFKF